MEKGQIHQLMHDLQIFWMEKGEKGPHISNELVYYYLEKVYLEIHMVIKGQMIRPHMLLSQ